ncbi:hypothetical protein DFP72DRAFT_839436 [Ephemerocybe angulata]|uniref:Uncharacterized protein n=1 Tax=Ephemerocybe angulata TaxID=980116 RepID=A0A8H6IJW2_9AGAR|nr:hypothetical protein DFP72DRAFT_839436 [Tulosesus angulatus]
MSEVLREHRMAKCLQTTYNLFITVFITFSLIYRPIAHTQWTAGLRGMSGLLREHHMAKCLQTTYNLFITVFITFSLIYRPIAHTQVCRLEYYLREFGEEMWDLQKNGDADNLRIT